MNIKNWKQFRDYFNQNVKLPFPGCWASEFLEWEFIRKDRKIIGIRLHRGYPAPQVCVYLVGWGEFDDPAVLDVDMQDLYLGVGKSLDKYQLKFPFSSLELASGSDIFSSKVIYQIQTTLQDWNQQALQLVAKYEADGCKMPVARTGVPLISDIVR